MTTELNVIWLFPGALSVAPRLVSWKSCGVSIWAKTSKYSLAPLSRTLVRLGRIEKLIRGLVNAEVGALTTITSGGMYLERELNY